MATASPSAATRRRHGAHSGANGSSLIWQPAIAGTSGSRKCRRRADDAALPLPALAEEDHVVPGEQRVLDLGDDGVVVADDARQQALTARQARERVATHLLAHGTDLVAGCLQLAEGARPDGLMHDSRLRWVGGADHTQVLTNETTKRPGARRLSSPASRTPAAAAPRSRPDAPASRARRRARA